MAKFNIPEDEYMIAPVKPKKEIENPIITRTEPKKKEDRPAAQPQKNMPSELAEEIKAVKTSKKKAFTYYLPVYVSEKLNEVSKSGGVSQSKLIELLVMKYL